MKTTLKLWSLLSLLLMAVACSDSGSEGPDPARGYTPANIEGRHLFLSATEDISDWYIDLISQNGELDAAYRNDTWDVDVWSIQYDKRTDEKALLIVAFTVYIGEQEVTHTQVLELHFTSSTGGTYIGNDEISTGSGNDATNYTTPVSGSFRLDSRPQDDGDDDDEEAENQEGLAISEPTISAVTASSATVRGTILAESGIEVTERGLCYATTPMPTVGNSRITSATQIVNATLTGLFEGTTYYVRLYARVGTKIFYGEQGSFTTTGASTNRIRLTATNIANTYLNLKAKLPNNVGSYGLCYGTSPQPKVTDGSLPEQYRQDSWQILHLTSAKTYYIRAYHIEGTKITYYEDSEVAVETLGKSFKLTNTLEHAGMGKYQYGTQWLHFYFSPKVVVSYSGLPEGTYRARMEFYQTLPISGTRYGYEGTHSLYVEGGSGTFEYQIPERFYKDQYITVSLTAVEDDMSYTSDSYSIREQ